MARMLPYTSRPAKEKRRKGKRWQERWRIANLPTEPRWGDTENRGKGEMAHARGQIKWAEWIGTVVSRWGVVQTHLCPAHSDGRLEMGEKIHAQ